MKSYKRKKQVLYKILCSAGIVFLLMVILFLMVPGHQQVLPKKAKDIYEYASWATRDTSKDTISTKDR